MHVSFFFQRIYFRLPHLPAPFLESASLTQIAISGKA
jgi:hypothetical protein